MVAEVDFVCFLAVVEKVVVVVEDVVVVVVVEVDSVVLAVFSEGNLLE